MTNFVTVKLGFTHEVNERAIVVFPNLPFPIDQACLV